MAQLFFFLSMYSTKFSKITDRAGMFGRQKAGSLKMNTALEYSTRVVQEGGRRCKKSTRFSTPDPSKNTFNEPAKSEGAGRVSCALCADLWSRLCNQGHGFIVMIFFLISTSHF
jgi:hypothetical protein